MSHAKKSSSVFGKILPKTQESKKALRGTREIHKCVMKLKNLKIVSINPKDCLGNSDKPEKYFAIPEQPENISGIPKNPNNVSQNSKNSENIIYR